MTTEEILRLALLPAQPLKEYLSDKRQELNDEYSAVQDSPTADEVDDDN